ncbi:PH domain-containing protein [Microbacterium radiodurans]|uniref:PH domain-containing protein n=1 Tax=Microbacterium radiodurans TaxID=661398 RepID=A0A5J5IXD3_9MICO|nr:PH domain-containing protein [Microbacterium radiodurans]KAA9089452.1 PH domain-containing protein [Microbacterium radiodurans]
MTTSPDHPSPTPLPPTTEPAAAGEAGPGRVLDDGAYDRLIEPRSANRLELERGIWHQISRKYLIVQLIGNGFWLVVILAAVVAFVLWLDQPWAFIPGVVVAVLLLATMAVLPRQVRSIGYQLREDDLVFRRGILWQRMVAVPYGRMQLVDITHGPLDRGFGIAQLKFVTAAAATGVTIPGLTQQAAEALRDHLMSVAESRRTGL